MDKHNTYINEYKHSNKNDLLYCSSVFNTFLSSLLLFEWEINSPLKTQKAIKALDDTFKNQLFVHQFAAIFQVDFQLLNEKGETSSFIANGEWALLGKMYSLYNLNTVIGNLSGKYPHPLITQTEDGEQFPFFLCTHKCS